MSGLYIHEAVMDGDCITLKRLLESGHEPNQEYGDLPSPMDLAIMFKNNEAIELLKFYSDKNNTSWKKELHDAIILNDHTKMISVLDEHTYLDENFNGVTPLCLAVTLNNDKAVKSLLQHGADPDIRNTDLLAPLHLAVKNNNTKIIEELIKYKANMNIEDGNGNTPLVLAIKSRNLEMCKILLKKGASANYSSSHELVPLFCAVQSDVSDKMVRLLILHGAEINYIYNNFTIMESISKICPLKCTSSAAIALVPEIVLSKTRSMLPEQEKGFNRNARIIKGCETLLRIAVECSKELIHMESIRIGKSNLYNICILKQQYDKNELARSYNRIVETQNHINIYKYKIIRILKIASVRRMNLQKAISITDEYLDSGDCGWNKLSYEIKYHIFSILENTDMKSLLHK
nr:ankyrin repeat protein [Oriental turtle dovepox virus]